MDASGKGHRQRWLGVRFQSTALIVGGPAGLGAGTRLTA